MILCARETFRSLWCQKEAAGSHAESSGKGSYESLSLGKHFSLAFASPVRGSQAERGAGAFPEPSSGDHPCRKAVSVGNPSRGGQTLQSQPRGSSPPHPPVPSNECFCSSLFPPLPDHVPWEWVSRSNCLGLHIILFQTPSFPFAPFISQFPITSPQRVSSICFFFSYTTEEAENYSKYIELQKEV